MHQINFHIFNLVWDKKFVQNFIEISLPFQLMPENLPKLTKYANLHYHIYTTRNSKKFFGPMSRLEKLVTLHFHYLEDLITEGKPLLDLAKGLRSPNYKYFIQKICIRDMHINYTRKNEAIILLDSNFVIADGGLGSLGAMWRNGTRAVMVNVLRITEAAFTKKWYINNVSVSSGQLYDKTHPHLHPLQYSYFADKPTTTTYPIQLCWHLNNEAIYARSFLPHPLMLPVKDALQTFQSTPDYDLALRLCKDDEITVCSNSKDLLICKFSDQNHGILNNNMIKMTPENLALFILTSTHNRHRNLVSIGNKFEGSKQNNDWTKVENLAEDLIGRAYQCVDQIIEMAPKLDARFLMHIKSYLGPIEDYMSPELEPLEFKNLIKATLNDTQNSFS